MKTSGPPPQGRTLARVVRDIDPGPSILQNEVRRLGRTYTLYKTSQLLLLFLVLVLVLYDFTAVSAACCCCCPGAPRPPPRYTTTQLWYLPWPSATEFFVPSKCLWWGCPGCLLHYSLEPHSLAFSRKQIQASPFVCRGPAVVVLVTLLSPG